MRENGRRRTFSPRVCLKILEQAGKKCSILMSSPTSALSYLLHCWLLQPMAEPEPRVPHRVNPSPSWLHGSASWARIVHTECIQLVAGRLRLLWCCIFEVRCRVWSLCALTCSSGSLSLTSGVRWPAWSRATAASLSSAPPPPPPANRSPARWSPGRHWKLRTSTPTTIPPPPSLLTAPTGANSPLALPRHL